MTRTSLIITSIACFILAGGIGYGVTTLVKLQMSKDSSDITEEVTSDNNEKTIVADKSDRDQTTGNGKGQSVDSNVDGMQKNPVSVAPNSNSNISAHVSASTPKKNGNLWSFAAKSPGIPAGTNVHYELWGRTKIASSKTGLFSGIPDSPTGHYKVCVVEESTGRNLGTTTVSGFKTQETAKMSAGTFQSLLLNRKDYSLLGGKNKQVARNISFSFTGLNEGENRPDDVQSIRDKIHFGKWISAVVVSVGYDENGKINSAVIRPVY